MSQGWRWCGAGADPKAAVVDSKYYEIIGAADAWQVAEDYSPEDDDLPSFHPTNSAVRVRDLFDQVTERYKPLLTFAHRAPFLLAIQVPLLEAYIARIASSIDAFESLSFGLMRAVPGSIGEGVGARVTAGVAGAQRLTRAGLSARWMAAVCNMWDDDVVRIGALVGPTSFSHTIAAVSRALRWPQATYVAEARASQRGQ